MITRNRSSSCVRCCWDCVRQQLNNFRTTYQTRDSKVTIGSNCVLWLMRRKRILLKLIRMFVRLKIIRFWSNYLRKWKSSWPTKLIKKINKGCSLTMTMSSLSTIGKLRDLEKLRFLLSLSRPWTKLWGQWTRTNQRKIKDPAMKLLFR